MADSKTTKEDAPRDDVRGRDVSTVLAVEARDASESTVDSLYRLAGKLGGQVKSQKGTSWTIECPRGSDDNPFSQVDSFAAHFRADPLVAEVTQKG